MPTPDSLVIEVPILDEDPFSHEILSSPYGFHERLREAGPVVYLPKYDIYAMGRYEHVHSALQNWETFLSGRGVGLTDFKKEKPWRAPSLLLEADPPDHTGFRKVMNGVLTPRVVRTLRTTFHKAAEELAEKLARRKSFDLVADLAEVYPIKVFPDALGISEEGRENLLPYGALAFNAFGPKNDLLEQALATAAPVQEWIMAQCGREKLAPGGFGAAIWDAADRGEITPEQAPLLVRSLLGAGLDTTVYGIGNTMYGLSLHPEQWETIHSEPNLAKFAFDEALRFESPVQTFFRTTSRSVEVEGIHLAEGTKVLLFLGSANRDPRKWGDTASQLDVRRNAAGHVAFGMGVHQCVGQPVARLEAELVVNALARRIKRIELDGEPVPKLNNTLKGWTSVPVKVTPA
ncbi:cytochrome P450 [Rhodococcus opacus]|uniref:Cytochrome P450 n=1 Tax=Rhodococcus opacus TaxID=37919 RepID=A0AAX3YTD2_RHOOP|nr:cytochrome P450 [Rhodococcus opacus]MCZ4587592.1 cytochrome P450 [Rhodococcus opacus]WLF51409.1 cytochrome P450 [Rhodococcus opacus]